MLCLECVEQHTVYTSISNPSAICFESTADQSKSNIALTTAKSILRITCIAQARATCCCYLH